jgi:dihydrolipoamide dehydrogenase
MTDGQKDLVVIGAGPGGYPAAFRAADLGMKVALVDPRANPGGVCLYCGCVPSKALLHVAAFLHELELAPQWGVSVGTPQVNIEKLRGWKRSVIENLTKGLGQLVRQRGIEYIRGTARLENAHRVLITPTVGETRSIEFEHAIVATGSAPATIPGTPRSPRIMNSQQALDPQTAPQRLLVVGGGYIGLELGQVYAALGSKVTVVETMPEILSGADRDLMQFLSKRLNAQFEGVKTNTRVAKMEETDSGIRAVLEGEHGGEDVFDKIMISVGRKPLTEELGLENTHVNLTGKGSIEVDGQRRTAEPSIFAVGDVAGEPMLAHKATHEGCVAAEAAAGKKTVFEPQAIPFVVFSDPEIAWCGLSQTEAERQGRKVKITTFPWAASGRAATISRPDGVTKLLCDPENGRILGVGIAGQGAGELLAEAVLAMEMGATADDPA